MEPDSQLIWNANDVKSSQLLSDKNPLLVNGHKPIVNPLYDEDEFDVDTETPFLAALTTVEVIPLEKTAVNDDIGSNENNIQTMEDGEILENSNDGSATKRRAGSKSASINSKSEEKSKRNSKTSTRKRNHYSPERRPSYGRRSGSYGARDRKRRKPSNTSNTAKVTQATRDFVNRDKRETKR